MDRHLTDQTCRVQLKAGIRPLHVPYNMHNELLLAAAVVEDPGQVTTGQGSVDQLIRTQTQSKAFDSTLGAPAAFAALSASCLARLSAFVVLGLS